jgi:hypothetical protein
VLDGLRGFSVAFFVVTTVEGLATTPAIVRSAWSYGRHRRVGAHRRVALKSALVGVPVPAYAA